MTQEPVPDIRKIRLPGAHVAAARAADGRAVQAGSAISAPGLALAAVTHISGPSANSPRQKASWRARVRASGFSSIQRVLMLNRR